jgi:hypothetical protein
MPVILAEDHWANWLGEGPVPPDELKALLVPHRDDTLTTWPVNRQRIGNVRNKGREVALPEALSQPGAGRKDPAPRTYRPVFGAQRNSRDELPKLQFGRQLSNIKTQVAIPKWHWLLQASDD